LAAWLAVLMAIGVLDVVATTLLHFDAWPGAKQSLSLFGGRFYQFPLYEFAIFPAIFVACAFLLFHRAASGETWIEQGIERLRVGARTRTTLRVLAFVAFCNVLNLAYTTTMGALALVVEAWPADMPSWLASEQCGGITGITCSRP
jgi:hypothetical protein